MACAAVLRTMDIFCPGVGAGGIFGSGGVVFYPQEVLSHLTTVFGVFLWMSYAAPFLILAVAIAFVAAFSSFCTCG